jgi:hypothetical protein
MMQAPIEIIDYIESLLSIFFYDIKQKERSVFILVDNLVEVSCKARLRERKKHFARNLELDDILKLAGIGGELKRRLLGRRKDRNSMQHDLVAITVTQEHCADSIVDLCKLLKRLWGKYAILFADEWIISALRIVKLYSRSGNKDKKINLENYLEKNKWNSIVENEDISFQPALEKIGEEFKSFTGVPLGRLKPKDSEIVISIGSTKHWTLLLRRFPSAVKICLDDLGVEEI